jgi:hypothetical protein
VRLEGRRPEYKVRGSRMGRVKAEEWRDVEIREFMS